VSPHEIQVWGGTVVTARGSEELHESNSGSFVLDLDRLRWRRE
jgi:hypothetical protein